MTPEENALVAYAILESAENDRAGGVDPAFIALDIARAQVYATLATVPAPSRPHPEAIQQAIGDALAAYGWVPDTDTLAEAAEAVARLL